MKFNEAELEQAVIELFDQQGYPHFTGDTFTRDVSEVLLLDDLRKYLTTRYDSDGITTSEVETIVRQLQSLPSSLLYDSNAQFMRWLSDGFLLKREDRNQKDLYIQLLDYSGLAEQRHSNPAFLDRVGEPQGKYGDHNIYKIVNQLKIEEYHPRIPDAIIYINGMPLVVWEFKSAIKENTTIFNAFEQLTIRYRRDIPKLFVYNAFSVISDGVNNKAGSLFAGYDFFYSWRKITGDEKKSVDGISSLHTMVKGMFDKNRLRDIFRNFIFFPDADKKDTKIVCRYPQYYGARKLLVNIKLHMRPEGDGKGGTYFGATGCGKSFTMLYLTRLLMKSVMMSSPTIVLITDRTDLDGQLAATFTKAKTFIGDANILRVKTRDKLKEFLEGRESGGVFLTTIQKFSEDVNVLTKRANVICISDEAHRSQVNKDQKIKRTKDGVKKTYGFAHHLHNSLPNATYVGFTGTPIDKTIDVFGKIVDYYTMNDSVKDEITERIVYEGRAAKVLLDNRKLQEIEKYYDKAAEAGASEYQVEESKKATTKMTAILGDPDRIKAVAKDFVAHYEKRIEEGASVKGKAIFVSSKREIAYDLYQQIIALRPEWAEIKENAEGTTLTKSEQKKIKPSERIKMVMTRGKDDPKEMYEALGNKAYREELDRQFKNDKSNFKIAIVVDMWLTGFDVPFLDTIYIDKPIQTHNLIQTISRVNRKFKGKGKGLVVDYIGIKTKMNLALSMYSQVAADDFEGVDKAVSIVKDQLDLLRMLFNKFDDTDYFKGTPLQQLDCLNRASEYAQLTEEIEKRFMKIVKKLRAAYNLCTSHEDISEPERDRIHFYYAISAIVHKLTKGEAPDAAQMNAKVNKMIQEAIISEGVEEIYKFGEGENDVDIFSEDYIAKINEIDLPNTKIKVLQRLLKEAIEKFKRTNKAKGVDFSKRMQLIVDRYNQRDESLTFAKDVLADIANELTNLFMDLREEKDSYKEMGIDFEEKAFYDILKAVAQKHDFVKEFPEDKFLSLAKAIKVIVDDKAKYTDWANRDDIKADLEVALIIELDEHGYPPNTHDDVYKEILEQAENFKKYQKENVETKVTKEHMGYLYMDTDDFGLAIKSFEAYKSFAKSIGLKITNEGELVKGSYIRRKIQLLERVFLGKESKEIFDKGKKAIELAKLEKVQSEINKNNAEAAAVFLNSVKEIPNVTSRFGSLVVIKITQGGEKEVVTKVLTMEQVIALDKNAKLMKSPVELLENLNGGKLLN